MSGLDSVLVCPVCTEEIADGKSATAGRDALVCRECTWVLRSVPQLGSVTPALSRAFAAELEDARRSYDIAAATKVLVADRTAVGNEGIVEPIDLALVVRGRSVETDEIEGTLSAPAAKPSRSWSPSAEHARSGDGLAETVSFLEITDSGVATTVASCRLGRWEATEPIRNLSWAELLPSLPSDRGLAWFALAGGVGREPSLWPRVSPEIAATVRRLTADGLPTALRIASSIEDWRIARTLVDRLGRTNTGGLVPWPDDVVDLAEVCHVEIELGLEVSIAGFASASTTAAQVLLVIGTPDGLVSGWTLPTGECVFAADRHSGRVSAIAAAASGDLVASGGWDGAVWVSTLDADPKHETHRHQGWVNGVALVDGNVVSVGDDNQMRVTVRPGRPRPELAEQTAVPWGAVGLLAASTDGRLVAVGGSEPHLRMWEATTGDSHKLSRAPAGGQPGNFSAVSALAFDPTSRWLVLADAAGAVERFDVSKWPETAERPRRFRGDGVRVAAVAVDPTGSFVAGDDDGRLRLFSFESPEQPVHLGTHDAAVVAVTTESAGRIWSCHADGTVHAWQLLRRPEGEDLR